MLAPVGLSAPLGLALLPQSSAQKASEHLEHEHVFGIEEQVENSMRQKVKLQIVSISRVVMSHGLCVFSCNMGIITRWLSPFVSDY